MLFDSHDDLVQGQSELSPHGIDDPAVGLMRHQPVYVRRCKPVGVQSFVDDLAQMLNRLAENLAALHPQETRATRRRRAAIDVENVVLPTVRMQVIGENKPRGG